MNREVHGGGGGRASHLVERLNILGLIVADLDR
jgi:hypothetical protein